MVFQAGNTFGKVNRGKTHPCYNVDQFKGTKWMQRNGEYLRAPLAEVEARLAEGWVLGRPDASEETRKKQSESAKLSNHPTHWKPGHQTWNTGEKMPEYARVAMSVGKLKKYGLTTEQVVAARSQGRSWCSEHLKFEPNDNFTILKNGIRATRCKNSHKKYSPWYGEQFAKQNGCCAICGEKEPRMDALNVDHGHECPDPKHTRKASPLIGCECSRGLLCSLCNPKLGYFEGFMATAVNLQFAEGSWEAKALAYLASYNK